MKEKDLRTLQISQGREKAKEIADLIGFDGVSMANYVMEVNLRGKEVEYETNLNPRYASTEAEVYKGTDEERIYNKSNNNFERLVQIVSNANRDFRSNYQYVVFHKDLVEAIQKWLDKMSLLGAHMKYGKIDKDLMEFKRIFPVPTDKDWLVIDGNSYFSTIHQIWLIKKRFSGKKLPVDMNSWAAYYALKPTKGKGYVASSLSNNEYERDIQMLQLMSLVLEKNLYSWPKEDIQLFYEKLYRMIYIISYTHNIKEGRIAANEIFSTMQAIRYLTLPTKQLSQFKQSKRIDYLAFVSLFGQDNVAETPLQTTTYNIQLFRGLVEGLLTKNANHLRFDYVMDCLNETHHAMVRYQNDSLLLLENTMGQSARDRLTRINALMKEKLKADLSLKDCLINDQLPVQEFVDKLKDLVDLMKETYEEYLAKNIESLIKNNKKMDEKILGMYQQCKIQTMSFAEFKNLVLETVKQ